MKTTGQIIMQFYTVMYLSSISGIKLAHSPWPLTLIATLLNSNSDVLNWWQCTGFVLL